MQPDQFFSRQRNFRRRHLREIHPAKDFVPGGGEPRVYLDFRLITRGLIIAPITEKRIASARFARLRLFPSTVVRRLRQHHRNHLLHEIAGAPEKPEGFVEDRLVLVAFDEDRKERRVEFLARTHADRLDSFDSIGNGSRTDLEPRATERPGEEDDIVGKAPLGRRRRNDDPILRRLRFHL